MRRRHVLIAVVLAILAMPALSQLPSNFSWINIETDKSTMPIVRRALHDGSITAIREVGVEDGFALVMTSSRANDVPTPDYDSWTIYSISLKTGNSRTLLGGYGVKLLSWIGPTGNELAISYYNCWECEAATLLTTMHIVKGIGWVARWPDKSTNNATPPLPGAVIIGDMGELNDDIDVDQIYSVVKQPKDTFAIGTWTHSRNTITGKIEDNVERYSIDPASGKERTEKLTGQAALNWKREICTQANILIEPASGQNTKACRSVMQKPTSPRSSK